MFSDEEIKEIPGSSFMRPGDEIIRSDVLLSRNKRTRPWRFVVVSRYYFVYWTVVWCVSFYCFSIREVCLNDKFDKKDLGFHNEPLLSNSGRNDVSLWVYLPNYVPKWIYLLFINLICCFSARSYELGILAIWDSWGINAKKCKFDSSLIFQTVNNVPFKLSKYLPTRLEDLFSFL